MNNGIKGYPLGLLGENFQSSLQIGLKNGLLAMPRSSRDIVEDYQVNINAVGGSLSSANVSIYRTFVDDLGAAGLLSKIIDCGTFDGGFSGSRTKLIYAHPDFKYLTYTNFVSGDYGDTTGLNASTANRKANTRIIPAAYGLNKDNYAMGHFYTSKTSTDDSYFMTDNKPSAAFQVNIRKASTYFNGTPLRTMDFPVLDVAKPRFIWAHSNGNFNVGSEYEYMHRFDLTSPQIILDSEISLFGGRSGGSEVNATGRSAFYFIAHYMSIEELSTFWTIVKSFLVARGRLTEGEECVTFGDSITHGTGASVYTNRYSYILSNSFTLSERNLGVIGSLFSLANSPTLPGGFERRGIISKYKIYNGGKVIIQYGVNDINSDATTNGDATKIADFQAKLIILANELKILGVPAANIQIGSINYLNNGANTTKMEAWRDAALNAAISSGVKYSSVYEYTRDNGGITLLADIVHPNNAGHAAIAEAHLNHSTFVP